MARHFLTIESITSAIVKPRGKPEKLVWVGLGIAVAIGLRWAIDGGAAGIPFVTIWPVLILTAVFLDWRHSALMALGCGFIASRLFMPQGWAVHFDKSVLAFTLLYVLSAALITLVGEILRRVVFENRHNADQSRLFNEELQHRTKNTLQIMRALIARAPRAPDPVAYCQELSGRLEALIAANELLGFGVLPDGNLRKLVESAIRGFGPGRFVLSGNGDMRVTRQAALPLVMALHELCTNAAKYGALARDGGRVEIRWSSDEAGDVVQLRWQEHGGPEVEPPKRLGLGSRILSRNGGLETVDVYYHRNGVVCRLAARLSQRAA